MSKILLTGGAGFIGSNLCKNFIQDDRVSLVRVLDNFSTGYRHNLSLFLENSKFELLEGDITNFETCQKAMQGIDFVSHQAALGSVPRSIENPILTNQTNINGTLNIFVAAKEAGIKKIVYAASSSTYGDSETLPKIENNIGKPLSPYAVTKYVMELYADVFHKTYNMDFIGLRYFNVFGPQQSPQGAYAAVIPLFMHAIINNQSPTLNGDGSFSRDFTFIENVVQANVKALFIEDKNANNQVYNVAFGESTTLLQLFRYIAEIAQSDLKPIFGKPRIGDIPHSLANIDKIKTLLNYDPTFSVKEGLAKTFEWYKNNLNYFK